MSNIYKRLVAGKELEELALFKLALSQSRQWFSGVPNVYPVINYIDQVVSKLVSPNVAQDILTKLSSKVVLEDIKIKQTVDRHLNAAHQLRKELEEAAYKLAAKEAELNKVHVQLAESQLKARQGWERYEEANQKYMMREKQLADLNQEVEIRKEWTLKWYSALMDCAQLMGIKVGESICGTPDRLREFLDNRNFVFRPVPDEQPSSHVLKRSAMEAHIKSAVALKVSYIKPGIPCNGCQDNCCTLTADKCTLAKMRKSGVDDATS